MFMEIHYKRNKLKTKGAEMLLLKFRQMKYLKGKKTMLTNLIINAQKVNNDFKIELELFKNGDLKDFANAKYFKGDYINIEELDKQISKLVKKGYDMILLRYPDEQLEFNEILLYKI